MNILDNQNLLKLIFANFKPITKKKIYFNINNKILYSIIIRIFNFDQFYKSLGSTKIINNYDNQLNALTLISENKIASTYYSPEFRIWDIETLELVNTLKGHENNVTSVLLLKNNNNIISCSRDGEIKVWDCLNDYKCIATKSFASITWLDNLLLLPNQNIICSAYYHSSPCIAIISCKDDYNLEGVLFDHSKHITDLVNLYDYMFASASADASVKIWETKVYKCLKTFARHNDEVKCLLFVDKDKLLISGSFKVVQVWDIRNIYSFCQCIKTILVEDRVDCLLLLPYGYFAFNNYGEMQIWNLTNFEEVNILQDHKDIISSMLVLNEDKIVSASLDGTIMIWGYD
jgi:WD40 repeat protein